MQFTRVFPTCGVLLLLLSASTTATDAQGDSSRQGMSPAMNYLLNCQGCHMEDGSGRAGYIPTFRDSVARFLAIPEGRAYLGRVPGTSQSYLDDGDRAKVLNWIITAFDPEHIPADFQPYTAGEMAGYRRDPVSNAGGERARLLGMLGGVGESAAGTPGTAEPVQATDVSATADPSPPAQFAVCAACHPTSTDGASAMGPNLRGVVGRTAGTLAGFSFSPAMRASKIAWSREELDAFLENVAAKIPGNMMPYGGVPVQADRTAIIDYLEHLH